MLMRSILFVPILFLLFCSAFAVTLLAADRPNIVFVYTDDQAPWALGRAGHPHAQTPHMDRLFGDGAYLVNAFTTTPVCSPSRASLMTSRYGSELGITDWINPRKESKHGLDPATVTWPELLQEAGYTTGLVGKWHLGTEDKFHPTQTGFDYFMGFRGGGNRPADPTLEKHGWTQKFRGITADVLTNHAIAFVEQQHHSPKPFLLCMHYRAPHAAWLPVAEEDWEPFAKLDPQIPNPDYPKLDIKRVKWVTREYLASVHSVDRNLGRLIQTLDELKMRENTVVIFSSDHGYNMGHNGVWHKGNGHWILTDPPAGTTNVPRGQRPNMYDRSIRVPTAICWPGVIEPGTVLSNTISNLDWFPTLLAIAGVEPPKNVKTHGRDFLPLLRGQKLAWDNDFYAEYSTHHQTRTHMRMFRTPEWKLVRDFLNPERDELYHLTEDRAETANLIQLNSPKIRQVTADLHKKILQNMRRTGDPVLKLAQARSN